MNSKWSDTTRPLIDRHWCSIPIYSCPQIQINPIANKLGFAEMMAAASINSALLPDECCKVCFYWVLFVCFVWIQSYPMAAPFVRLVDLLIVLLVDLLIYRVNVFDLNRFYHYKIFIIYSLIASRYVR